MNTTLTPTKLLFLIFGIAALGYFSYFASQASVTISSTFENLSYTPTDAALDSGLVYHFTFDEWSGTTLINGAGDGDDGVITSMELPGDNVPAKYAEGFDFDGAAEYVRTTNSSPTTTNMPDVSWCIWFYSDGIQNTMPWRWFNSGNSNHVAYLELNSGVLTAGFRTSDNTFYTAASSNFGAGYWDTAWHHGCVTFDRTLSSARLKLYVDGALLASDDAADLNWAVDNSSFTDRFDLARNAWNGTYFNGKLDDFRMYDRALSQDEISRLYRLGGEVTAAKTLESAGSTLSDGLVGHWTFDGPDVDWSSTTAEILDVSGSGNNLNALGGMSNAVSPSSGIVGQSLLLNGTSHYASRSVFSSTLSTYSICLWVKLPDPGVNTTKYVLQMARSLSDYSTEMAFRVNRNAFGWRFQFADITDFNGKNSTTYFGYDEWHMGCVVRNNTTNDVTFYLDGVVDGVATTFSANTVLAKDFAIGMDYRSSIDHYAGSLDDVRIYNRALSASEIAQLYAMGGGTKVATTIKPAASPLEQGLVGHWTFDGPDVDWSATTAEIKDVSTTGADGNALNGMSAASVVPGVIGQALVFPGGGKNIDVGTGTFVTGAMTVSAWVKPYDTTDSPVLAKYLSEDRSYSLSVSGNDVLFQIYKDGTVTAGQYVTVTGADVVPTNEWTFIAGVFDGNGTVSVYADGVFVNSAYAAAVTSVHTSARSTTIGLRQTAGADANAEIDDVRIYDRALSQEEVQQLYQMRN